MNSQIISTTDEILGQLIGLCEKLNSAQYAQPLKLLSQNTIGKHYRHIIEFYDILMEAYKKNKSVCYDNRMHCNETETNLLLTLKKLVKLSSWICSLSKSKDMQLDICYNNTEKKQVSVCTNLERELVYNIEHAIHHMAIIRIAIEMEFPEVIIDKNFGVAYSTIRHRDISCAH